MAVLKRLTGDVTVTVEGKSRSFTNYGIAVPSDLTYSVLAGRTAVLSDPTEPDSIEIVTPPARGKMVPRADGRISFNLNEELATTDIPFTYERTKDGTTSQVDAVINVSANLYRQSGWSKTRHYMLEVDNNDAIVIEPRPDTRFIHISSSSGLSRADILARHSGSGDDLDGVTNDPLLGMDLFNTPARDATGVLISPTTYYGETEALAVDHENGNQIFFYNRQSAMLPVIVKFKRGDTFTGPPLSNNPGPSGYSPLKPNAITSYGSGALPKFTEASYGGSMSPLNYADMWVWQDLETENIGLEIALSSHIILDNVKVVGDRIALEGGSSYWAPTGTARRFVSLDAVDPRGLRVSVTNVTSSFTPGATATGANSGAEAVVQLLKSGEILFLEGPLSVPFITGETITDTSGGSATVGDEIGSWEEGRDFITEGGRLNNVEHAFFEKGFVSGAGWSFVDRGLGAGYRPDRLGTAGRSPTQYSHSFYGDANCLEVYMKDLISLHPSHSAFQIRSGGIAENIFCAGGNTGFSTIGNGCIDATALGGRGDLGCWSMLYRVVHTEAGWKDMEGYSQVIAGGTIVSTPELSFFDSAFVNGTSTPGSAETPYTDATAVTFGQPQPGRAGDTNEIGGGICFSIKIAPAEAGTPYPLEGTFSRENVTVSDWSPNPGDPTYEQRNLNGVDEATRRSLTVSNYADDVMSSSGETLRTFDLNYMRTLDAPWEELDALNNYFLDPFGKGWAARTVAQTVTFMPDAGGDTPGQIALFSRDWDTHDLPGTVDGDSIDLAGHTVYWNMTPKNGIANFDFGVGGYLEMWGGALKPTGTVTVETGGNTLHMYQGSKFHLPAHSSANLLTTQLVESRFLMDDTVTGPLDFAVIGRSELVFYEGADVSIQDGRTIEVSGNCDVGFDGSGGGAAALTMASGSTLSFKRGCVLNLTGGTIYNPLASITGARKTLGVPKVGDVIEGATSGATGVVGGVYRTENLTFTVHVDNVSGQFQASELLVGPTWMGPYLIGNSRTDAYGGAEELQALGTVSGTPTYTLPTVKEFVTGLNGTTDPNVASSVTLASGSTVTVDTTGLTGGGATYDLIDVDSLTNNGATLPSGVAVSGNKLVLTVS